MLIVWSWALLLILFISLLFASGRGLVLLKTISVALMGAFTAVAVGGQALFASPTLVVDMTDAKIAEDLDPGLARGLVLLPDTMSAVGGILLGLAFLVLGWVLWASDLVGRRFLAITAGLMGLFGSINLVLGGGSPILSVAVWAVAAAILTLISRQRIRPPAGDPSIA